MSSYCGVVHRRGAPVDRHDLSVMAASLSQRAPDTTGFWLDGAAGFFHAMRFTTPESLHEPLPWRDAVSGLVITADARIDNRASLGDALGLSTGELEALSDSALLLHGYCRWGEVLLDRLLGDFSFTIWDAARRTLFCARDHFGVRPFYHTLAGDEFVFATDPRALFVHPRVSKRLNVNRWLGAVSQVDPAQTETFYAGIYRLAPGSFLRFDENGLTECRYWSLDPGAELPARTSREYADEFRTIFTEAVRCRLRSAYPIGTHLSGGLDSTAVTCIAREVLRRETTPGQLPLRTFSNVLPSVEVCDESEYISAVLAGGDLAPHLAQPDSAGVMFGWDEFLEDEQDLIFVANHYLLEHLGAATQTAGVRVCLDGFDGDTTVGHGYERFADLADAGDWTTFSEEAQCCADRIPEADAEAIFVVHGLPALERLAKTRRWMRYLAGWLRLHRHYDRSIRRDLTRHLIKSVLPSPVHALWQRARGQNPPGREPEAFPFFTAPVAARLQAYADAHVDKPAVGACSVRALQCHKFAMGLFSHSLEVTGRLHARYGIDARHPFLDKRLVEFCVALPADQKLSGGQTRYVMREGLRGVLPEVIRQRWGKTNYTTAYVAGALRYDVKRLTELIRTLPTGFDRCVDPAALEAYLQSAVQAQKVREKEFLAFWRALMSMAWLQQAGVDLPTALKSLAIHP